MTIEETIARMTLRDRVALCSGGGAYETKALDAYGIPRLLLMDGPHGIRKPLSGGDVADLGRSEPATCFPAACLTACSWDRELLQEIGVAIAQEARQHGVAVVLGPGVNIKRNPLCGRNFEYYSEDPFLAGELATWWIRGLQSQGVGASLKHFAANNQETDRMTSDSLVDERTLREIYLAAFERAATGAQPATVMCGYNKLNGTYCSDHKWLVREILRDEWGFRGLVITDWGAMNNRIKAFEAGVDLEMPDSDGWFDEAIMEALNSGELSEGLLNESVARILALIDATVDSRQGSHQVDLDAHHQMAKRIALNAAVLLKNTDGVLPFPRQSKVALIGALAKEPRYQGAGSSHINPTRLSSAIDGFEALGLNYGYSPGYSLTGASDAALENAAIAGAQASDLAVVFAGLPEAYESEGFDRADLTMPDVQNQLISRVAAANPNTVVVLSGGAPIEMPWLPEVKAVLHMYLPGQAGGLAAAELLVGDAVPCGKLGETYPLRYADVPSAGFYENGGKQAQYREALYVGYRYYDAAGKDVLFPFGHGLSYTTFQYTDLALSEAELAPPHSLTVSCRLTNTGPVAGAEVVQLYVGQRQPAVYRPKQELKEFAKVWLQPGQSSEISFTLDARSFAIYDPRQGRWVVPDGVYRIAVGASSRDIRLEGEVTVHGEPVAAEEVPAWYRDPVEEVTQSDFEALLGQKIEPIASPHKGAYTIDCSLEGMGDSLVVRHVARSIRRSVRKGFGDVDEDDPTLKMMLTHVMTTPLRRLSQLSPGMLPKRVVYGLVDLGNGRIWRGLKTLLRRPRPTNQG